METFELVGTLITVGIFLVALFSAFSAVISILGTTTQRRLSKLEEGQMKLEEGQIRFDTELKEIKQDLAKLKENQARFERQITLKLDKILSQIQAKA